MRYQLFFGEIKCTDSSKTWRTTKNRTISIQAKNDEEAITMAKAIMNNPEDPLVERRIPQRLMKLVEVESWK